jgi:enoyl-CoA hydratase
LRVATSSEYLLKTFSDHHQITLVSSDGTNRLTRIKVTSLVDVFQTLTPLPIVLTGNERFFSVGADLNEIRELGADAFAFARLGQTLMNAVAHFPAPVIAALGGYCMGGGLDLALACHARVSSPNAVFGHRGASLGIMTGWGGTQRLPRLIGKSAALQMFICAQTLNAAKALHLGLLNQVSDDPVALARSYAARCFAR